MWLAEYQIYLASAYLSVQKPESVLYWKGTFVGRLKLEDHSSRTHGLETFSGRDGTSMLTLTS